MSSIMKELAADEAATAEARKQTAAGGDGTVGASSDLRAKMVFTPDAKKGVWGNEDSFQKAIGNYVSFIGSHPVFSPAAARKGWPVKEGGVNGSASIRFNTRFWWPSRKTTLAQYCTCNTRRGSKHYLGPRVRRSHCEECGFHVDPEKRAKTEYVWDPVVDDKKGRPDGGVFSQGHVVTGFHYKERGDAPDVGAAAAIVATELQRRVGKERTLGRLGNVCESYNLNAETRRIETQVPDGPAAKRAEARGSDMTSILAQQRRQELLAKYAAPSDSSLRAAAMSRQRKKVEGMVTMYEWGLGEPYPYGEQDKPSAIVEGPARTRMEEREKERVERLSSAGGGAALEEGQSAAYVGGEDVLRELRVEQREQKVSKALRYYALAKEGRERPLEVVIKEERAAEKDERDKKEAEFVERRRVRQLEATKEAERRAKSSSSHQRASSRAMLKTTFGKPSLRANESKKKVKLHFGKGPKVHAAEEEEEEEEGGTGKSVKGGKRAKRSKAKMVGEDWEFEESKSSAKRRMSGKPPPTAEEVAARAKKKALKEQKKLEEIASRTHAWAPPGVSGAEVDDDERPGGGGGGLIDLAKQRADYEARVLRDQENADNAKREAAEKDVAMKSTAASIRAAKEAADERAKGGRKRGRKGLALLPPIEGKAGSTVVIPADAIEREVGKKQGGGEDDLIGAENAEEEGEGENAAADAGAADVDEVLDLLNPLGSPLEEKKREETPREKPPPPPHPLWKYVFMVMSAFFTLERLVLWRIPPYKRFREKQLAARSVADPTGALAAQRLAGNPLEHYAQKVGNFVSESVALLMIAAMTIYIELERTIRNRNRLYTIDDLESAAIDGDNTLVLKCVSQIPKPGYAKLNVDAETADGKTPLMCAFEGLLAADADEKSDPNKRLQVKASKTNLMGRMSSMFGARTSASQRYYKTISTLLAMNADVNAQQNVKHGEGYSLIHLAALEGNVKRIAWLLSKNVSANKVSLRSSETPLHCACKRGHCEAAMLLIVRGATLDQRDVDGRTPLHMAAATGGTHIVRVMLISGARKDIWDNKGSTPFDNAVAKGMKSSVESLLVYKSAQTRPKEAIGFLFNKMLVEGEKTKYVSKRHREETEVEVAQTAVANAVNVARNVMGAGRALMRALGNRAGAAVEAAQAAAGMEVEDRAGGGTTQRMTLEEMERAEEVEKNMKEAEEAAAKRAQETKEQVAALAAVGVGGAMNALKAARKFRKGLKGKAGGLFRSFKGSSTVAVGAEDNDRKVEEEKREEGDVEEGGVAGEA